MSRYKILNKPSGHCFIISAPSGSGKSTLIQQVLKQFSNLEFMVSYTTREPRPGEIHGVDYHFVDDTTFDQMLADKAFLEWANVHDRRYGTPKAAFEQKLKAGIDLILEIDVQGAQQVRQCHLESQIVTIFVLPSSPNALETRLRQRGKDSETKIARRLLTAKNEITAASNYNYLIVNDDLSAAAAELHAIILAQRCKLEYRIDLVKIWQQALKS